MLDVSIIIVSFNTRQLTTECLDSLKNNVSNKFSYETIVVDNASKDDSVEYIKKHYPDVKMIASTNNEGFSRANNHGVKISKGRYVLFLNSDTVVYRHSLEKMIEFMDEHTDAGASTCFLETPTGEVDDAAHRGFPTPWNALCHFSGLASIFPNSMFFNGYHLAWKDLKTKTHEIDALAGALMLVRREAGEQVGWWDEDYFFYGEDIDFCYSLKEKGWKIYFIPEVKILHYKGMSSGIKEHSKKKSTASIETKIWVTNHRFDAMKTFYRKHYQKKYPGWLRWAVLQSVELKRNYTLKNLQ